MQHLEPKKMKRPIESFIWHLLLPVLMAGLGVFVNWMYDFIASPEKPPAPNVTARLALFLLAILFLSTIIVGVAAFLRRRNRDVILLKTRLSEIYLSALRESAFNPDLSSHSLHD